MHVLVIELRLSAPHRGHFFGFSLTGVGESSSCFLTTVSAAPEPVTSSRMLSSSPISFKQRRESWVGTQLGPNRQRCSIPGATQC